MSRFICPSTLSNVLTVLGAFCAGCTPPGDASPADDPAAETAAPTEAVDEASEDRVIPPAEWFVDHPPTLRSGPPTLCLLFDGARVDSSLSFIVPPGRPARIPAFDPAPYGDMERGAAIAYVVQRVAADYAATALRVETACTLDSSTTRIVVGGHPRLVGEARTTAGIAPFDVGNTMDDDVGFAFSEVLGSGRGRVDLDLLADVVSHEAAHTFGLDHVRPRRDLMHPTVNDTMSGFTAAETMDGTWQDGPAMLLAVLGRPSNGPADPTADGDSSCDNDADDSGARRAQATPLQPDEPAEGHACQGDDDWFSFEAAAGDAFDLELVFPDETWVDPPAVFPPRARLPIGTTRFEAGVTHVNGVATLAGRYRIRVSGTEAESVRYALRVRLEPNH